MSKITLLALSVALVALQGCAAEDYSIVNAPDYGNAVRQNVAAETVNPMAPVDRSAPLSQDAQRAALAQQRYTTDQVEKPMEGGTLTGVGGGGGGQGGGGGGGGAAR